MKQTKSLQEATTGQKLRGAIKCAEWLAYCVSIGFSKDQLPALEEIWYKFRDESGNLKPSTVEAVEKESTIEELADRAFEEEKEGNVNYWVIDSNDPDVKYWKEVWIKGFKAAKEI